MFNSSRIYAIILRHLLPTFRDPMRLLDMFYWPLLDLILFGFIALWVQEDLTKQSNFILILLTCIIFWYLINRTSLEISRNLLFDIWDYNLTNLLATPLSITDMFLSLMIMGLLQGLLTFIYCILIVWFVFSQNIFSILSIILPFVPILFISGWIIGIIIASIILYFGKSAEMLAWSVPWFFAIISGAYYPLKLFPKILQNIAYVFPTSYLFEGLRHTIQNNQIAVSNLIIGFILSILYLLLAFLFLYLVFNKSKKKGLSTL